MSRRVQPAPADAVALQGQRWTDARFALAVTIGYLAVAVPRVLGHVMWRDEWQTWLLCRASGTFGDLLFNRRYDGHPLLWYVLVWPLTRLTADPAAMKLLHVALAGGAVYLLARFATPLTRAQRVLAAFGYYLLFEYSTITRNYAAAVLLLFAFCASYAGRRAGPRLVLATVMLALLAQTSAFGTLLAGTLAVVVLADAILRRRRGATQASPLQGASDVADLGATDVAAPRRTGFTPAAVASGVVLAACGFAVWSALPPGPSSLNAPLRTSLDGTRAAHALAIVWQALVPVPKLQPQFWNTNVLDPTLPPDAPLMVVRDLTTAGPRVVAQAALGVALFAVVAVAFWRCPAAVMGWVVGTGAVLGFAYAKYFGFLRHHGHLWLLLLALVWIAPALCARGREWPVTWRRVGAYALTAGLAVHVLAAGFTFTVPVPFSASRAVAEYVRANYPPDAIVAGDPHYVATGVAGRLGRELYYPATDAFGTFVIWDATRPVDYPVVMRRTLDLPARHPGRRVVLLTNYLLPPGDPRFRQVATFGESVVPDEVYVVYEVGE